MVKIVFCHNVYDRPQTLIKTIEIEKNIFSDSIVSVAYNNKQIEHDLKNCLNIDKCEYFDQNSHKTGCVNGCIISIQNLIELEFDVLIFSHDDVRISKKYIEVVNKNVNKIKNGIDIIARSPISLGDYIMMESFYCSKKLINSVFRNLKTIKNDKYLPKDNRCSFSPEVWFFNILNDNTLNKEIIKYEHNTNIDYNLLLGETLGFEHLNVGLRGWKE